MKHRDFYVYQVAETVLNTSIRTVGFLFAWLMLTVFKNPQHLGGFYWNFLDVSGVGIVVVFLGVQSTKIYHS